MDVQNKIGRDHYEEMKAMFTVMFNGDQAKVDIIMRNKMAQFFKGETAKKEYTWTPATGKTAGIPRTVTWSNKIKRDAQTAKFLLPMELNKLLAMEIITQEQFNNITAMIASPDEENLIIAEQVINQLRQAAKKRKSNGR